MWDQAVYGYDTTRSVSINGRTVQYLDEIVIDTNNLTPFPNEFAKNVAYVHRRDTSKKRNDNNQQL